MISKDAYGIIASTTVLLLIWMILSVTTGFTVFWILTVVTGLLFLFNFFFFRDPSRRFEGDENAVCSPADGTIIKIETVNEPHFFNGEAQMISIFMSVFNVHVNRVPITGRVRYVDYRKGKFLAAFRDEACESNEQTHIAIEGAKGNVFYKQIAGVIARRIVCRLQEGDEVQRGERFGMIKYGSRLDVYLPPDATIRVRKKQKVKAGQSVMGVFAS